jgi:hypothetical protein
MASGKVHQKSNRKLIKKLLLLYSILFIISYLIFGFLFWQFFLSCILGLLFGYLYGPDLDQQQVATINETELAIGLYYFMRNYLRVPYPIANLIKQIIIYTTMLFWSIYSLIPHRHKLSHSYIWSTLLRNIYFLTMTIGVYLLVTTNFSILLPIYNNLVFSTICYILFFINNCIIDANHLRLDKI